MIFNPDIFREYDIRGIYGAEFDDEFAHQLGVVLVDFLKANKIVIAHDMRNTSATIANKLIEGITKSGCEVVNIGVTSTPLFYFGVINEQADGGVMVTASHLGEEYNGFKPVGKDAVVIGGDNKNFGTLKKMLSERRPEPLLPRGTVIRKNILNEHTQAVIKASGLKSGQITSRVKLDANQMIVDELGSILLELGVPIDYNNPDVIFTSDSDGDRVQASDGDGFKIRGDLMGGLLARAYFKGKSMVHDIKFSQNVVNYLKTKDVNAIAWKTGHGFIKEAMRGNNADYAAEFSGHHFFKAMGSVESPGLMMLLTLYLRESLKVSLKQMIKPLDSWSNAGELEWPLSSLVAPFEEIKAQIKQRYVHGQINELDGINVVFSDWRWLARPSSTHPAIICIVEANTQELMEEKKRELMELLGVSSI